MTETYTIRPEEDYQRFLNEGRFMIQRARGSGKYIFYPRVTEPLTGDEVAADEGRNGSAGHDGAPPGCVPLRRNRPRSERSGRNRPDRRATRTVEDLRLVYDGVVAGSIAR